MRRKLNLYIIHTDRPGEYDIMLSVVVAAESMDAASKVEIGGDYWPPPERVAVEHIGYAKADAKPGDIIHTSFRAG